MKHLNSVQKNSQQTHNLQSDYDKERLVLDYLNDHLDEPERIEFENQLHKDTELKALVEQSDHWQNILHKSYNSVQNINPDFVSIEHKLHRKKPKWLVPVIPAALACMIVFTISSGDTPFSSESMVPDAKNQSFDTLTQPAHNQQAMMQLILAPNVEADSVIEQYDLNVIESFSNQRILNVELTSRVNAKNENLLNDKRIMLLKEMGKKQ